MWVAKRQPNTSTLPLQHYTITIRIQNNANQPEKKGRVLKTYVYCMAKLAIKHLPYTWNFSRHVYFTVKHETRIFAVEISRMKVIQKFSCFSRLATRLCTKNVCYKFKRDRQNSLPNSILQQRQSQISVQQVLGMGSVASGPIKVDR